MQPDSIARYFDIPRRFVRSVQLERDFGDPQALDDYIVTPAMAQAFARIAEGLRPNAGRRAWRITGDYGVGKSSFALVAAHLLSSSDHPGLARIRDQLGWSGTEAPHGALWPLLVTGSRSSIIASLTDAIARAVIARRPQRGRVPRAHHDLIEQAARFRETHDLAVFEQLLEAFSSLAASEGAGVLLIIDEMGKFLEHAAHSDGREDVFVLQRLAEHAARSGREPFVLLALLHQGFHAYAERLPAASRHEWEKVAGRFEEIVFDQPLAHMAALVTGALRVEPSALPAPIRTAATRVAAETAGMGWLAGGTVSTASLDLARLYPLHPTVLPVLVRFFARFGQHERSLFGFLLSNEPYGLQSFAEREISPSSWYRLDDLYDYVRACFGHRLAGASYRSHWLRIVATIDSANCTSKDQLRILKAVAVLNLIDADDLLPTDRALTACFGPESQDRVVEAFAQLVSQGHLFRRGASGGYRLWPSTSLNLEVAFDQASRAVGALSGSTAAVIEHLSTEPILARRHYLETGTLRYFEVRYCEAPNLAACAAVASSADGLLLVVLAENEADRNAALDAIASEPLRSREDLLVRVPPVIAGLGDASADLNAWIWLSRNTPELTDDPYALAEVARQVEGARRTLLARAEQLIGLRDWIPQGQCFWKGEPIAGIPSRRGMSAIISVVCDRIYPQAPRITNELLNRGMLSSAASAARMRLVERLFHSAELADLGLDPDKAPPEKSIYLSVLKAGKIHVEECGEHRLVLPLSQERVDPLRLGPAIRELLRAITELDGDRVRVTDLQARLRQPPFGVRDGVSPLLLALVLRTHAHELAVYEHGTFLHRFGPSDFQRLIKGPQHFEIQHCLIAGVRLEVFDALVRSFADAAPGGPPDLLDVVRPLCQFAAQLPDYSRKATGLSETAQSVRDALLSAREPLALLFHDLPRACSLEPFRPEEMGSEQRARQFADRLHDAVDELRHAYDALLARILDRTKQALRQDRFDRVALAARASRVSLVAREPRLRTFALRLRDPGLSDTAWAEALASYVVAKPPAKWLAADEARFIEDCGALAEHFCKTEAAAFARPDMPGQVEAIRLNLTRGDGEDRVQIIEATIDTDLAAQADLLDGRLPQDRRLRLRLLTELLWRELKSGADDADTATFDSSRSKDVA